METQHSQKIIILKIFKIWMTQLVNDYKIYMKLKGKFGRDIMF